MLCRLIQNVEDHKCVKSYTHREFRNTTKNVQSNAVDFFACLVFFASMW